MENVILFEGATYNILWVNLQPFCGRLTEGISEKKVKNNGTFGKKDVRKKNLGKLLFRENTIQESGVGILTWNHQKQHMRYPNLGCVRAKLIVS